MDDHLLLLMERPIVIHRVFLAICGGNYPTAALLTQLWHWHLSAPNGIITRTRKEMLAETGLSEGQLDSTMEKLERRELISKSARSIILERRTVRELIREYALGILKVEADELAKLDAASELFGKAEPAPPAEPPLLLFVEAQPIEPAPASVDIAETEDIFAAPAPVALTPTPGKKLRAEYTLAIDTIVKAYDAAYREHVSPVPVKHSNRVFIILAAKLREKTDAGERVYYPEQLGAALASAFAHPDPWIRGKASNTLQLLGDNAFPQLWADYLQSAQRMKGKTFSDGKVTL